jgi:chemotaxis protein histidine kinase CheA
MTRPLSIEQMFRSAPDGARPRYKFVVDKYGRRVLLGVACRDWGDPDCPVWVHTNAGHAARVACAADAAEDSAARAEACCAAAMAARRLAFATAAADGDVEAVERVVAAARAAYAACEDALRAAADAHDAALAAAATCDVDRAADLAEDASAAAKRAEEAADAATAAFDAAAAEAISVVGDADTVSHACNSAWDVVFNRAKCDFGYNRKQRAPRWHPTGYAAGHFDGEPRQALEALAKEYLGVRV